MVVMKMKMEMEMMVTAAAAAWLLVKGLVGVRTGAIPHPE